MMWEVFCGDISPPHPAHTSPLPYLPSLHTYYLPLPLSLLFSTISPPHTFYHITGTFSSRLLSAYPPSTSPPTTTQPATHTHTPHLTLHTTYHHTKHGCGLFLPGCGVTVGVRYLFRGLGRLVCTFLAARACALDLRAPFPPPPAVPRSCNNGAAALSTHRAARKAKRTRARARRRASLLPAAAACRLRALTSAACRARILFFRLPTTSYLRALSYLQVLLPLFFCCAARGTSTRFFASLLLRTAGICRRAAYAPRARRIAPFPYLASAHTPAAHTFPASHYFHARLPLRAAPSLPARLLLARATGRTPTCLTVYFFVAAAPYLYMWLFWFIFVLATYKGFAARIVFCLVGWFGGTVWCCVAERFARRRAFAAFCARFCVPHLLPPPPPHLPPTPAVAIVIADLRARSFVYLPAPLLLTFVLA